MSKDTSIFYLRWLEDFEDLSNEQFGMVIRAAYGLGESPADPLAAQACKVITNQIRRDGAKYEAICKKRKANIEKRWRTDTNTNVDANTNDTNVDANTNDTNVDANTNDTNVDTNTNDTNVDTNTNDTNVERVLCSDMMCSEVRCSEVNPPLCPPQGGEVSYDTLCNKNACAKSKKKESKTVKFVPPTVEEVQAYLTEKGITDVDAEAFVAFYESKGWMVGKNKMQRWRSAITTWRRNGYGKRNAPQPAPPPTLFGDMSVGTPAQKYEVPDIPAWD